MEKNETNKFGIYIVLINIIITLFMLTSKDINTSYYIITIISNIIAIIFNIYIIKNTKKKTLNIISLILNMLILFCIIIYTIKKLNII